jgi:RNA polymerase sigma-70 factor (ECF subfamily)
MTAGDDRLSQMSTHWPELARARADGAADARRAVLFRYGGAVYRYLLAATRDPHAADDLSQEFALRFLRGTYDHADPAKGRFRDLVKTVLHHLVVDHYRTRKGVPLPDNGCSVAGPPTGAEADEEFLPHWRGELLDRAWDELRTAERASGRPVYTVLKWRVDHPDLSAAAGAAALGTATGSPVAPDGFRQWLHRARGQFADLLWSEVAFSVGTTSPETVAAELAALGLLRYFPAPAMTRR